MGIFIILVFAVCFTIIDFYVIGGMLNDFNGNVDDNYSIKNHVVGFAGSDEESVITDELRDRVSMTIEWYLSKIFLNHSNLYCGEVDYDDAYSFDSSYVRTKQFNSLTDVKSYYDSIVSLKYFNDNLADMFIENDNKLYCKISFNGSLDYEPKSLDITAISYLNGNLSVQGIYKTSESDVSPSMDYNFTSTMVLNLDSWVIDSFHDL